MTKKLFGALAFSTLIACSAWAESWDTTVGNIGGYSIDGNGVYTDSKGFMLFEGLTLDGVDYSTQTVATDASSSSANRSPVKLSNQTGFASLWIGGTVTTKYVEGGPKIGEIVGGSTLKNVNFSGGNFTVESIYHDPSALMLYSGSSLENVNFSGSTFSGKNSNSNSCTIRISGDLNGVDFSETTISSAKGLGVTIGSDTVKDVDFSGSNITAATYAIAISASEPVENISIEGATINASERGISLYSDISGFNAQNAKFTGGGQIEYEGVIYEIPYSAIYGETNLKNADFRGATVNDNSFSASDIVNDDGTVKNALLGDGTIYSATYDGDNISENQGLVLEEGETFTVNAYTAPTADEGVTTASEPETISAKLTVDSLVNGTIEIEVGNDGNGQLVITSETTLTLSENAQIVVKIADDYGTAAVAALTDDPADSGLDLSTLIVFEDDTAELVIEGSEDMSVQEALASKIVAQNSSGETLSGVTFTNMDTIAENVSVVVPEPSAFGLLAGLGALALVAARRRRR